MFRMVVAPGHAKTNRLGGLIMEYKILIGFICALLAVVFAVGALALALGIGPVIFSLAATAVGGFGMVSVATLIGE